MSWLLYINCVHAVCGYCCSVSVPCGKHVTCAFVVLVLISFYGLTSFCNSVFSFAMRRNVELNIRTINLSSTN